MSYRYEGEMPGTYQIDENGYHSATRVFKYHVSKYFETSGASKIAAPTLIKSDSNLPRRGSALPGAAGVKCRSISVGELTGGDEAVSGYILVTASYSTAPITQAETDSTKDPWNQPLYNFSLDPLDNIVPLDKAWDMTKTPPTRTKIVENSAKVPLEGLRCNSPTMMLRFSYNLKTAQQTWTFDYYDTINAATIIVAGITIPKYCGRMGRISAKKIEVKGSNGEVSESDSYYQVDVEIELKGEEWKEKPIDAGFDFIAEAGAEATRIWTDNRKHPTFGSEDDEKIASARGKMPVDKERKLNGSGGLLAAGADAVYLEFFHKREKDWKPLSLPEKRT